MYCSDCGAKIAKNAKFCPKCGKPTTPDTKKQTSEKGLLRKALKAKAKGFNKTPLILTMVILIAISFLAALLNGGLASIQTNNASIAILALLSALIALVCSMILNFGIIGGSLDIAREKNITISDVIVKPFYKIKNILLYFLFIILIFIAFVILFVFPIINILVILCSWFAIPILFIYFYPVFDMLTYLIMDDNNTEQSFIENLKKAYNLVKGKRIRYYGMLCSFMGWLILSAFTFNILSIWVMPYMRLAVANMYLEWTGEKTFEATETGLSDGAVIGITVGGYVAFIILFIIFIIVLAIAGYALTNHVDVHHNPIMDFDFEEFYHDTADYHM